MPCIQEVSFEEPSGSEMALQYFRQGLFCFGIKLFTCSFWYYFNAVGKSEKMLQQPSMNHSSGSART